MRDRKALLHPVSYELFLMRLVKGPHTAQLGHYPRMATRLLFNQLARQTYADFKALSEAAFTHEGCRTAFEEQAVPSLVHLLAHRPAAEIRARVTEIESLCPPLSKHIPPVFNCLLDNMLKVEWGSYTSKGFEAVELLRALQRTHYMQMLAPESVGDVARKVVCELRYPNDSFSILASTAHHHPAHAPSILAGARGGLTDLKRAASPAWDHQIRLDQGARFVAQLMRGGAGSASVVPPIRRISLPASA